MGIDQLQKGALWNAAQGQNNLAQQQANQNASALMPPAQAQMNVATGTIYKSLWKDVVETTRINKFEKQCEDILNKEKK